MTPTSNSEARKRRATDNREWGNAVTGVCPACGSAGTLFVAVGGYITCSLDVCPDPTKVADDLNPPRPRTVTIELPEDMRDRWAVGLDIPAGSDLLDIIAACRASRDAEQ